MVRAREVPVPSLRSNTQTAAASRSPEHLEQYLSTPLSCVVLLFTLYVVTEYVYNENDETLTCLL